MSWLRYKGRSCYGFLCCCCLVQVLSNSFVTSWTIAYQAPLFMPFSRKEYWNGLPFPSPGDLPYPGVEPAPPALATREAPGFLFKMHFFYSTDKLLDANQGNCSSYST